MGGTGIFLSILVGAIIWFVLQVIIGVLAWVSIVAGGVVLASSWQLGSSARAPRPSITGVSSRL